MSFYFIYFDESFDTHHWVYSAVFVPVKQWQPLFQQFVEWRRMLSEEYGISPETELHATDFTSGRGEPLFNYDKDHRADLFSKAFDFFESIRGIKVINGTSSKKDHLKLFEWMINRIDRTLQTLGSYGVIVCDEGDEGSLIPLVRRMKKNNLIPTKQEFFLQGSQPRYLPLERIIEDPLFKKSHTSYFIQMADFIAFGLLRNEHPTENTRPAVKEAFDKLDTVLVKQAFRKDPKGKGIVRV